MTLEEFKNLKHPCFVEPIYEEYSGQSFEVLSISHREMLLEINQSRSFGGNKWYRYENLKIKSKNR